VIRLRVEFKNGFRLVLKRHLVDLRRVVPGLLEAIRHRIHQEGKTSQGRPFSPYAHHGDPGDGFFWVGPKQPQPAEGMIVKARQGPRAGSAAYPSREVWRRAVGKPQRNPKRMSMSEELSLSLRDRYTGNNASIEYPNTRRRNEYQTDRVSNRTVARVIFRRETRQPLMPSPSELAAFEKSMAGAALESILVAPPATSTGSVGGRFPGRRLR
jgi:hypothetical protein